MRLTKYGMFTRKPPTPKMPEGMVELMEGLTKEVLKHNPPNVYEFCANHMEQLLIIRDGRAPAPLPVLRKPGSRKQKANRILEKSTVKSEEPLLESKDDLVENSNDVANTNSTDTTAQEVQITADTLLKAPVHPEKELTNDMEVEIFHEPVESTSDTNGTEKDIIMVQEALMDVDIQKSTGNVSEPKTEDLKEEKVLNLESAESDTEGNLEDKKSSSVEEIVTESDKENASHEHVRERRSVVSSEKEEETNLGDNSKLLEDKNNSPAANTEMETVCVESAAQVDVCIDNGSEVNEENVKEIDSAPVFAVEVANATHADESWVSQGAGQVTNEINEPTKTPELILEETNDTKTDETETVIDEQLLKSKDSVSIDASNSGQEPENMSSTIVSNETKQQPEHQPKPIIKGEPNQPKSIKEDNVIVTDMKAKGDNNERENDRDSTDIAEKLEGELSVEIKEDFGLNVQMKQSDDNTKLPEENLKPNNDKSDISENVSVLENDLPDETPESSNGEESLKNLAKEENNNGLINSTEVVANEVIADEPKNHFDSNPDDNYGVITTVNKLLVDESAVVKDDNDSVPSKSVKPENTETEIGNLNGNHDSKYDNNLDKELEQDSKTNVITETEPEIVSEVRDNVFTGSAPFKTDTSSMEQTSSMDDSIIDESNGSFVEAGTPKPPTKSILNKDAPSMDLETAAITIQKVFRSFLFRSRGSTFDDTGVDDNLLDDVNEKVEVEFPVTSTPLNKERRPLGISRMDTVLQTVNEEKSLSLSTDDSSLSSAATIIQAHVRGFLVRNRLNSNKTNSTSLVNSDELRTTSFETDGDQKTNKTILNIHIVPEGETFLNRDESLLTSIDLSLDGSPPSSVNLHPLGYDKSEPRKQLKREDAIQSISPPSNNSGKLSEDVDSVKDLLIPDSEQQKIINSIINEPRQIRNVESRDDTPTRSTTIETVIEAHKMRDSSSSSEVEEKTSDIEIQRKSLTKINSDENDVVTPYEKRNSTDSDVTTGLLHSGEFHDIVLPTKVSRSDTTVVREFKNVLVYFLLWNNS